MFHSSRGKEYVSASEALLNGLAKDGGLYVFDSFPKLDYKKLIGLDYSNLAAKILSLFFEEFSEEELLVEIRSAYQTFDCPSVVELKKVEDAYFLELFHGPTLAFKDLALVVLPRLMKLAKQKLGYEKNITILTATSGDTGGAALNGFKDVDGVSIAVLYPNQGVSLIQEAQMCSFRSSNAFMFAVEGNFDDCQSAVKQFFNTHKELSLSSANSMNIGRLLPQIVYYFYSYIQLYERNEIALDELVNFVVPTGNFGNIFAAFCAKQMGLPIGDLICASNKNDVLTQFFNTGVYNKKRPFYKTNSPSMDILISSNLERFLYYAVDQDSTKVKELMEELKKKGSYSFTNPFSYMKAYSIDEQKTVHLIKSLYQKTGYLIDPHTAVAYGSYLEYKEKNTNAKKTVIVSTASPFKFPQAMAEAFHFKGDDVLQQLSLATGKPIPAVLNYPPIDRRVISLEDVESKLLEVIK